MSDYDRIRALLEAEDAARAAHVEQFDATAERVLRRLRLFVVLMVLAAMLSAAGLILQLT